MSGSVSRRRAAARDEACTIANVEIELGVTDDAPRVDSDIREIDLHVHGCT